MPGRLNVNDDTRTKGSNTTGSPLQHAQLVSFLSLLTHQCINAETTTELWATSQVLAWLSVSMVYEDRYVFDACYNIGGRIFFRSSELVISY